MAATGNEPRSGADGALTHGVKLPGRVVIAVEQGDVFRALLRVSCDQEIDCGSAYAQQVPPDYQPDAPPTWDTFEFLTSSVADPRIGWARRVLRTFLGERWPETQWRASRWLPSELIDAGVHVAAGPRLLQLAANLTTFACVPGFGDAAARVRSGGITRSDWHHLLLQLEIARAGLSFGATVRFEPAIQGTVRKADVELTCPDPSVINVETVALWSASASAANEAWDRDLTWRLDGIARAERVAMECEVIDHPGDDQLESWLAEVGSLAAAVARSGIATISHPGWCRLQITAARDSRPAGVVRFAGMPNIRDGWARARKVLRGKARQTSGAHNVWIRIDMLDGLFAFSGWAHESPQGRLSWMCDLLLDTLRADPHIQGVIVSSGMSFTGGSGQRRADRRCFSRQRCSAAARTRPPPRTRDAHRPSQRRWARRRSTLRGCIRQRAHLA